MTNAPIKLFDLKEDATNYTIIGDKRMGKTTLLKNLIKMCKKHDVALVAYDRLMQFNDILPCYETCASIPGSAPRQFCVMADSIENVVLVVEQFRKQEFAEGRKTVFVIDELDTVYNQWGPITEDGATKTYLTEWIDYSRHRKLELWGCVRRPQKIWTHYLEQSNRLFLFHTSGNRARKVLLDNIGSDSMVNTISRLPEFRYVVYPDELADYDAPKGRPIGELDSE